jgi:hypothetical protein
MSLKTVCNHLPDNTHETAQLYTCITSQYVHVGIVYIGCIYYITIWTDRMYIVVTTGVVVIKEIVYVNYSKLCIPFIVYWVYRTCGIKLIKLKFANSSGCAVWGVSLLSLACWVCGFESLQVHGYLCLVRHLSLRRADYLSRRVLQGVVCLSVID